MTEPQFWKSTCAKVMALYRLKIIEWGRDRDYFPALCVATIRNALSSKTSRVWTADDILRLRYPPESVMITQQHDPDRGAMGDWKGLKQSLKERTRGQQKRKQQQQRQRE